MAQLTEKDVCLIVAHDAGGAEILASYVRQNQLEWRFVLAGPAINVFQRKLGDIELCQLEKGLSEASWCLCGTSWQSDLEWQAIELAQCRGKPVVAFIDHWVNYPDRFIRQGCQHLPDEIWVGDEYAKKIADKTFVNIPIKIVKNPYLIDVQQELALLDQEGEAKVPGDDVTLLFLSENISDHAQLKYGDINYFGYTEFDAIEFVLKHLDVLDSSINKVLIRPHPSDKKDKFALLLNRYPDLVVISEEPSLLKDILQANIVAGCQTVALVVALLANKRVVSCIPVNKPCVLPYPEIISLNRLILTNKKN